MELWLRVGKTRVSISAEESYTPEVIRDWAAILGQMVSDQRLLEQTLDERTLDKYGGSETGG